MQEMSLHVLVQNVATLELILSIQLASIIAIATALVGVSPSDWLDK